MCFALLSQFIEGFLCCKQRQLAICQKVLLVVGNNDITAAGNGTLILQHVLKAHLLMIYAKRSSLAMSSSVTCPMPRNFLNSSGSSGKLFQSIAVSWTLALDACLLPDVIARSAFIAFSINPSSVTMIFSSLNSSAFNCIAVIILILYNICVEKYQSLNLGAKIQIKTEITNKTAKI